MHRTSVALRKTGGKLISTRHGMRRILKQQLPTKEFIEKAVECGIYRSNEEIEEYMKQMRKSQQGQGEDPRVLNTRFRRDIVRGIQIQDYPSEYYILARHPPVPEPPKIPKKTRRRMLREMPKHPTDKLVKKYLVAQERKSRAGQGRTEEEYYQQLLGVPPPSDNLAMGQKSALLSQAYAFAIKQYELIRTTDMSEEEALAKVDELLAADSRQEARQSRATREKIQQPNQIRATVGTSQSGEDTATTTTATMGSRDEFSATAAAAAASTDTSPSIVDANPRVVEGMMQWSQLFQKSGIPYKDWTVGASTALDHWIAVNVLQLSEATWENLLEGNDPSLISRGEDIVAIRETLFPETRFDVKAKYEPTDYEQEALMDQYEDAPPEEEDEASPPPEMKQSKTIEELLRNLKSLDHGADQKDDTLDNMFGRDSGSSTSSATGGGDDSDDDIIRTLTRELQVWRAKNQEKPYDSWDDHTKDEFMSWFNKYINTLTNETDRPLIDMDETRKSLLEEAPETEEEADEFWSAMQDQTKADIFLQNLLQNGPPDGLNNDQKSFWALPYQKQLEKLVNLGTLRPLLDDYMSDKDRRDFMRRYGDYLLEGVMLDHLVPDPEGAITANDVGSDAIRQWNLQRGDRFSLVKLPYNSGKNTDTSDYSGWDPHQEDDEDYTGDEYTMTPHEGRDHAMDRARALYYAWNQHKAGRARYEEMMFVRGDLGLSYTSKTRNQQLREDFMNDVPDSDDEDDK